VAGAIASPVEDSVSWHDAIRTKWSVSHANGVLLIAKVARCSWAPRTVLEFAIKTGYVLDSWKTVSWPWIFSGLWKFL